MSFEPKQIEMVCLEDLVSSAHIYRKFLNLWNLDLVRLELERLEAESDSKAMEFFRNLLVLVTPTKAIAIKTPNRPHS